VEFNGNDIIDISPLSGLTNLATLYLSSNQISDISPLSGLTSLTSLTRLSLDNNQIIDISPLSGLTNLTELNLGYNQIIDINPLSGLVNITLLWLQNNQISDISPLSGLMNFIYLDLQDNPLNGDAYNTHIPQILVNNPGMTLLYDTQGGSISGYKFEDINGNGTDDSEPRLSNWTIELYLDDGDGIFNETTPVSSIVTSSGGDYSFLNIGVGDYWVREVLQAGWIQTTVDPSLITTQSGDHITEVDDPGLAFGNKLAVLLSDDFNDGNYDGWSLVDQGTMGGSMAWSAANGVMVQSSNVHSSISVDPIAKLGTYAYWQAGTGWTDYTASITIKSTDNDAIGIMFRYQDENNYYRFIWDKERNSRQLVKCEDGNFSVLAEDSVPYVTDTNYQVKISVQGDLLNVAIDGSLILSATDSSFSTGTIALYSWGNSSSYFDNILVEGLFGANQAPVANAGLNQIILDVDDDNIEQVTLDGSGSTDSDGTIHNYLWTEGATILYNGPNPTVQVGLDVNLHTITLTVTDDDGATDSDIVTIIIHDDSSVSISGYKFEDINDNCIDDGEPRLFRRWRWYFQ
jgi:hypothetical protein